VAKRPRPEIRPRIVNDAQLAAYLGKSVSWLQQNRMKLEQQGFPGRLPVVGGTDLNAVDAWIDGLGEQRTAGGGSAEFDALWQEATRKVRM
jgi:hypothetical protein